MAAFQIDSRHFSGAILRSFCIFNRKLKKIVVSNEVCERSLVVRLHTETDRNCTETDGFHSKDDELYAEDGRVYIANDGVCTEDCGFHRRSGSKARVALTGARGLSGWRRLLSRSRSRIWLRPNTCAGTGWTASARSEITSNPRESISTDSLTLRLVLMFYTVLICSTTSSTTITLY